MSEIINVLSCINKCGGGKFLTQEFARVVINENNIAHTIISTGVSYPFTKNGGNVVLVIENDDE